MSNKEVDKYDARTDTISIGGGTFTIEQVREYAASLKEGDYVAINVGGELVFSKVVPDKVVKDNLISSGNYNKYLLRRGKNGVGTGFTDYAENPYIILTMDNYSLSEGDKVVCLVDNHKDPEIRYGDVFDVYIGKSNGVPYVKTPTYYEVDLMYPNEWGIIPRYSQVSGEPKPSSDSLNMTVTFKIDNMDELHRMLDDLQHHLDEADRLYNAISEWKPDINIVKSDVLKRSTGGDNNE